MRKREKQNRKSKYEVASLLVLVVKKPPPMQETCIQSLGQEDLLEKEMATHSSILLWRIPWTDESGYSLYCCIGPDMTEGLSLSLAFR